MSKKKAIVSRSLAPYEPGDRVIVSSRGSNCGYFFANVCDWYTDPGTFVSKKNGMIVWYTEPRDWLHEPNRDMYAPSRQEAYYLICEWAESHGIPVKYL